MFQYNGYFKEFWIGNKFIGTTPCELDREEIGYFGAKIEEIKYPIILSNGKKIKQGIQVKTLVYPVCTNKI